ncbi:hypothetical protein [Paraflavitalea speifideaquila]|uniref:hypothetical protein n=1 Tax=Paraflavitalea speifideaquila TaxID=3076558 RepID=UPI0028E4E339|nr:hypothetical protein [Paraflavitalea speifideiaquila]
MRRITVLLWIASFSLAAHAQHDLSGSRKSSVHTYIYRISAEETQLLYGSKMDKLTDKYLHTPVDSFVTDGEAYLH